MFEHRKVRPDEHGAFENYKKLLADRGKKKALAVVAGDDAPPKTKTKAKAKAGAE